MVSPRAQGRDCPFIRFEETRGSPLTRGIPDEKCVGFCLQERILAARQKAPKKKSLAHGLAAACIYGLA